MMRWQSLFAWLRYRPSEETEPFVLRENTAGDVSRAIQDADLSRRQAIAGDAKTGESEKARLADTRGEQGGECDTAVLSAKEADFALREEELSPMMLAYRHGFVTAEGTAVSRSLEENASALGRLYHADRTDDLKLRFFTLKSTMKKGLLLAYIDGMVDPLLATQSVIEPLMMFAEERAVLSADVMLLGDSNMPLTAKTALLCREDELVEVWWAHPSKLAYAFDPAAEKELKADLKTLQALVDSFLFDMEAPQAVPHMNIAADNGLFSISAPLDTIVITPETDQAAVSRAKSRFAGLTGGSECFDIWYLDVTETNRWLLLSPEHGLAAEVSVCTDEAFDGVAMDDLADRGTDLLAQLSNQYDHAAMSAETEKVMLDGMPHWWNTYDLEHAGMELLCYAFTTVQDGTFYELTIFLATNTGKDVEEMSDAILLMMDTIDYLPGR
jgi:hypothetical protein